MAREICRGKSDGCPGCARPRAHAGARERVVLRGSARSATLAASAFRVVSRESARAALFARSSSAARARASAILVVSRDTTRRRPGQFAPVGAGWRRLAPVGASQLAPASSRRPVGASWSRLAPVGVGWRRPIGAGQFAPASWRQLYKQPKHRQPVIQEAQAQATSYTGSASTGNQLYQQR